MLNIESIETFRDLKLIEHINQLVKSFYTIEKYIKYLLSK